MTSLSPFILSPQYLIQEREAGMFWGTCIHFVETAPSVLREMPWVVLKEHTVGAFMVVYMCMLGKQEILFSGLQGN